MTEFKIEEGKCYRSDEGEKVGPMFLRETNSRCRWGLAFPDNKRWDDKGVRYDGAREPETNLIAEWTDEPTGPVIIEARKVIKPGNYGIITVWDKRDGNVPYVGMMGAKAYTAAELREAAAHFIAIADALDEPR